MRPEVDDVENIRFTFGTGNMLDRQGFSEQLVATGGCDTVKAQKSKRSKKSWSDEFRPKHCMKVNKGFKKKLLKEAENPGIVKAMLK